MTLQEAINKFEAMATAKGLEAVNLSDGYTLRIEYRKNGRYVGGASYIGGAKNPENVDMYPRDFIVAKEQIKYLASKRAQPSQFRPQYHRTVIYLWREKGRQKRNKQAKTI